MSDFVRVKSKTTGHEYTVGRNRAEQSDDLNIIPNKQATNLNGDPLPPKYMVKADTAPTAATKSKEDTK